MCNANAVGAPPMRRGFAGAADAADFEASQAEAGPAIARISLREIMLSSAAESLS
jgi:hypothetical protein